jgi:hypothetical protein
MNDELLNIENNILSTIDRLDSLLSQYINLNKPMQNIVEGFSPILFFRKRSIMRSINNELNSLTDNLDLLEDMMKGTKLAQFQEKLIKSNENVKKMAVNLIQIAPKYLKIKGIDENTDKSWRLLQYNLRDQDNFTDDYNKRIAKNKPEYCILSILNELKMASEQSNIDYSIFLSRSYPKVESIENSPLFISLKS